MVKATKEQWRALLEATRKVTHLEAERDALARKVRELEAVELGAASCCALHERLLGELLAIIHGDGGHYVERHGMAKAVEDAQAKWWDLVTELDSLRGQERPKHAARVLVDLWEEAKWLGEARLPEPLATALDALGEAMVAPEDKPK